MLFFQGDVTYEIEGKSYRLQPYDIVVVPAGQMHRPVVGGAYTYERIIAYISPAYIESYRQRGCDLSALFQTASPILRQPQEAGSLYGASCRLRQACCAEACAHHAVLKETLFLEFLIYLAQSIQERHIGYVKTGRQNEKIQRLRFWPNSSASARTTSCTSSRKRRAIPWDNILPSNAFSWPAPSCSRTAP